MSEKARPLTEVSPSKAARINAGLSLEAAAKAVRICPEYLSQLERSGKYPFHLACRLSHLYGCGGQPFMFSNQGGGVRHRKPGRNRG